MEFHFKKNIIFHQLKFSWIFAVVFLLILQIFIYTKVSIGETQPNVDSLKKVLSTTFNEKSKIDILNKISDSYIRSNPKLAALYNQQSLSLSERIDYEKGKADAFYISFKICRTNDDYKNALINIGKIKVIYQKTKDLISYADCLVDEASILMKKQDLKSATVVLLEAASIYESKGGKGDLALLYNTLGSVNLMQGNINEALKYQEKSLSINQKKKFEIGISVNYINIGNIYNAQKKHKKAIEYYHKALDIKQRINDWYGIQKCLNNLGVSHMNIGELSKAIDFHKKALDIAKMLKNNHDIAMCFINLGYDYQKSKSYEKATFYSSKGLYLAEKNNDISLIKEARRVLSESFASKHNFAEAYQNLLVFKQISDSLVTQNNYKEMSEIQTRFEITEKDNQIKELNINTVKQEIMLQRVRVYIILFIGLLFIVLIIVAVLIQQSKNNKKINAKLQEINAIKSAFFANLSHEFRTPLTLMLGPSQKLLKNADPESKPLIELIYRNASRLLALDEQLLEFTRIDSGNQKLKLNKGDIIQLISAIVTSFSLLAQNKNIVIDQQYEKSKLETFFDPDIVEKVISNLISNAIKYTANGGKVVISVYIDKTVNNFYKTHFLNESKKVIRIDVLDNGQGIPFDKQDLIFERFYQLNNYTSGMYDGYGIGLALVKELIQLHKGEIILKSKEDEGSLFSIILPSETKSYTNEELNNVVAFNTDSLLLQEPEIFDYDLVIKNNKLETEPNNVEYLNSILIVDDNPDMRIYLYEILKDNYHISQAADGIEGLELAIQSQPDLIVTDIMMHKMDGIEFSKELKKNSKTFHIPVIMLTALTALEDKIYGLENGADDYIEKPFNARELIVRIKNLIHQRKFLKELFTKELKLEPNSVLISSVDAVFIQKLITIIENNIDNSEMDVEFLANSISMSRSQLHRRITTITGQAASSFIRIIRLKRAAQLMKQKSGNISEIMYAVGFNNLSYFSKCFREIYNMSPSEFINKE